MWLHKRGVDFDKNCLNAAAYRGSMSICRWAAKQGTRSEEMAFGAAASGNLELLTWSFGMFYMSDENLSIACMYAASGGHLDTIKWLKSKDKGGCELWKAARMAAMGNHFDVLRWIVEQYPCVSESADTGVCTAAAARGDIHMLTWAHAKGLPWDAETCRSAAHHGQTKTLQWLRQQGCPWDSNTPKAAASMGHFRAFTWSVTHGCPITIEEVVAIYEMAIEDGNRQLVDWLQAHRMYFVREGAPTGSKKYLADFKAAYLAAARASHT